VDAPVPATPSAVAMTVDSVRNMLVGSVTISAARRALSSWKMAAHGQVAPGRSRAGPGHGRLARRGATSAASWATSGAKDAVPPAFEFR
jgi:hypothetical protein